MNGFLEANDRRLPLDVDGAKRLLAEAGYPNGFGVTMDCPNDRYVNDEGICTAVVAMLARIGVRVTLAAQTARALLRRGERAALQHQLLPAGMDAQHL